MTCMSESTKRSPSFMAPSTRGRTVDRGSGVAAPSLAPGRRAVKDRNDAKPGSPIWPSFYLTLTGRIIRSPSSCIACDARSLGPTGLLSLPLTHDPRPHEAAAAGHDSTMPDDAVASSSSGRRGIWTCACVQSWAAGFKPRLSWSPGGLSCHKSPSRGRAGGQSSEPWQAVGSHQAQDR